MDMEQLVREIKGIPVTIIDESRKYWLIRTQSGDYYNEYFHDNFVAIGWDDLNLSDLDKFEDDSEMLEFIKIKYPDEKQPGRILSQIKRFTTEIRINDIVLIPSESSNFISFGVIESEVYTEELDFEEILDGSCPFTKRRKVNWIKTVKKNDLDPYLYRLLNSHHTITDASNYDSFIDRTLHSMYIKGKTSHLILNVKRQRNIPYVDLINLLKSPLELMEYVEEFSEQKFEQENLDIKVSLQSPGVIEIIYLGTPIVLFGLSLVLHYIVGGKFTGDYTKTESEHKLTIESSTDGLLEKFLKFKKRAYGQKLKELEMNKEIYKKLEVQTPNELNLMPEEAND